MLLWDTQLNYLLKHLALVENVVLLILTVILNPERHYYLSASNRKFGPNLSCYFHEVGMF